MLSYISSYLATRPLAAHSGTTQVHAASAVPLPKASASGVLQPEAALWEVRWEELSIERPIGRGSFGVV